jgi:hypothetical protein
MYTLAESLLGMKADIYRQVDSQDENTGAIKREWVFIETIPCNAKGVISNSATSRGGDKQTLNSTYHYQQLLEIRTLRKLTLREKIVNIRDSKDKTLWAELDYPTETPTVFEVIGSTPITEAFTDIMAYNSTIKRSENQQIGL